MNKWPRIRQEPGFTIIEAVVVILLLGVMAAVAVPRAMRTTPQQQVHEAARQLLRDLEQARMQAISAKRIVRVSFYASKSFYAGFIDTSAGRSGAIQETPNEARAAHFLVRSTVSGLPGAALPKHVSFGFGSASRGPLDYAAGDPIVLSNDRVEFDVRGMVRPVNGVRTGGVIVFMHDEDPEAVSAVTITGAGAFRTWDYRDGQWR